MRKLVVIALMLFALTARAETIPFAQYVTALERLEGLLRANQLDVAKNEARALIGKEVASPMGDFHADDALLLAVAEASRADRTLQARLATTAQELRRLAPASLPPPDPKLLHRVAAEQDVPELVPGGEVPTTLPREIPLMERVAEAIGNALEWLGKQFRKLIEWLLDFLPRKRTAGKVGDIRWGVIAMVALIVVVLVILAIYVLRRVKKKDDGEEVAQSAGPVGSKRDENPLSRAANEWERYAARLADEGRNREAIRAWYHAVLVTCYTSGILYFRKGRTNWEYVSMLSPSLPWRPEMIALTRRFEVEWYGHEESSEDALDECSERARRILGAIRSVKEAA